MYQLKHSRDQPAELRKRGDRTPPNFWPFTSACRLLPSGDSLQIYICFLPLADCLHSGGPHFLSLSSRELRLPPNSSSVERLSWRRFWGLQCGHRCASNSSDRDSFTENILSDQRIDDFRPFLRNFLTNFTTGTNFVPPLHFCT